MLRVGVDMAGRASVRWGRWCEDGARVERERREGKSKVEAKGQIPISDSYPRQLYTHEINSSHLRCTSVRQPEGGRGGKRGIKLVGFALLLLGLLLIRYDDGLLALLSRDGDDDLIRLRVVRLVLD